MLLGPQWLTAAVMEFVRIAAKIPALHNATPINLFLKRANRVNLRNFAVTPLNAWCFSGSWDLRSHFSTFTGLHVSTFTLQWHHNERDGVSNHRRLDGFLNRLFRRRSKKTSKLHVTGLCEGNPPMTGEVPPQRASNAENVSIWWRHHETIYGHQYMYDAWWGTGPPFTKLD